MAARFWRSVFGGCLAIFVLFALVGRVAWGWPAGAALLITLAGLLALPCLVAASLIHSSVLNRGAPIVESRPLDQVHAWLTEPIDFSRAVLAMMTVPNRRPAAEQPATERPARPVLLIHGIVCNRGIWRAWFEPLRAAGFAPVRAVDLEPLFGDIDRYAADVAMELRALQRRTGGARVAIVAHSMGGLVARAALQLVGPEVISRIVTIASPHHGTRWARLTPLRLARQMRPDSIWLRELNALQEGQWPVPVTSIYSMQDEFIVPARSAVLAGAQPCEMRGVGHLGVLGSAACMKMTLDALRCA